MPAISFENQIMPGTFEHTIDYLVETESIPVTLTQDIKTMTPEYAREQYYINLHFLLYNFLHGRVNIMISKKRIVKLTL
jgi:hypothetical protein